jgi:hypothetical protein
MKSRFPDDIYQFSLFPFLRVKEIARLDVVTNFLCLDRRAIETTLSEYAQTKRELIALRINTPLTRWLIQRQICLSELAVRADYWGVEMMPALRMVSRLYVSGTGNATRVEEILTTCKQVWHLHVLLESPPDLFFSGRFLSLCPELRSFELSDGGRFMDFHCVTIMNCAHLESVRIDRAVLVSDFGLTRLIWNCPNLHTLHITGSDHITDETINVIADWGLNMQTLKLSSAVELSNNALSKLFTRCTKLNA